jgi:hypothetical protein
MSEVYAVVEGRSEKLFVERLLAVHLGQLGISLRATQAGKPGHKMGVAPWRLIREDIVKYLRMNKPERPVTVTTMYDYYRMPPDWPGREEASNVSWQDKGRIVEESLAEDIRQEMGNDFIQTRFIPYVQVHEFEALILARPEALRKEFPERNSGIADLVNDIGDSNPESINDGPDTSPSRRIIAKVPEYAGRKATAAANVLRIIDLDCLRSRCGHFNDWVNKLENLRRE